MILQFLNHKFVSLPSIDQLRNPHACAPCHPYVRLVTQINSGIALRDVNFFHNFVPQSKLGGLVPLVDKYEMADRVSNVGRSRRYISCVFAFLVTFLRPVPAILLFLLSVHSPPTDLDVDAEGVGPLGSP